MWIVADVTFDTDAEAREAERLAREGKLAGVSADMIATSIIEIKAVDEDGFPTDWLETVTEGEILGATQVAMPAFAEARIESTPEGFQARLAPEGIETSDKRIIRNGALSWRENAPLMFNDTSDGHEGAVHVGNLTNFRRVGESVLVASDNPHLQGLTRPRVVDGEMVGHGAGWGTCHTGIKDACVTPPTSTYRHVSDGAKVYRHPNGDIHAPLHLSVEDAMAWYEAHCDLVGVVGVGEDDFGIWVSGETELDDGEVFLSGDWRGDDLELISLLVVENPGFPTALVAAETQTALVAAGIVTESDDLGDRVSRLEAIVEDYRTQKQAELLTRTFGDPVEMLASAFED